MAVDPIHAESAPWSSVLEKDLGKDIEKGLPIDGADSDSSSSAVTATEAETALPETAPEHAPTPAPQNGPPDGGLEAWLQVVGSWGILACTWGLVNSFGVYQTYYEVNLNGASASSISWIGSLQAALLMWVGVISGPLFDAGYFRLLVIIGSVFIVFGQFMTSLCTQYWQVLLAQGICIGIGMGLTFLPSAAILSQYFKKRRALAIGIASTGSPIGGIIFPIIFSQLQPSIGFGWATRVIAFILLGLSVIAVAVMHTRVPPSGKTRQLFDRSAFQDVPYILVTVASFFAFLTLYVAFFYMELFTELHHLSTLEFAPYTVTLLNVGSVFGRVIPNAVADKLGPINVVTVCTGVSGILLFGWFGLTNLGGVIVWALLYGLFSGALVSLLPSTIMALAPDLSRLGARMGMCFLVTGCSILVGTPTGGAILGGFSKSEWDGLIGFAAAGLAIGFVFFAWARYLLWKAKGTVIA